MCGIAGLVSLSITEDKSVCSVQAMTDAERHRGPDSSGVNILHTADPSVVLGHRRLAILDLSPAGHQPMQDPETGCWITFNGEIYNFQALRRGLEQRGMRFHSRTDTEVILKLYAVEGTQAISRLRGIFSFGIWDPRSRTLVLARDQLGVKPLYIWQSGDTLLFASEVRALLASSQVPRRLNLAGLRSYLAYGSVQDPLTLVENVESLKPGHILTWHGGDVTVKRYWSLPAPEQVRPIGLSRALDEIGERLAEAVRLQLVADVPLGIFLSGGIDSTAIAALSQRGTSGPVKTFSIIFDEPEYDERIYSRAAAEHIGTEHAEILLHGEDVRASLPRALASFDQPSLDGLNTYFVSQAVHEAGLTVALSGLGGDELFGGYEGYRKPLLVEKWGNRLHSLPGWSRGGMTRVLDALSFEHEWLRKTSTLLDSKLLPYFAARQVFSQAQVHRLLAPDILRCSEGWEDNLFRAIDLSTHGYDPINRASALEIQTYMLSTLLRDADQMSMAHGLELRVPFLDHMLVELLFSLPGVLKVDAEQPKPLLTRALNGALPDFCVYRAKRGFELPFKVWLFESLRPMMQAVFTEKPYPIPGLWDETGLTALWEQFNRGTLTWSRVWGVFVLCNWLARHRIAIA